MQDIPQRMPHSAPARKTMKIVVCTVIGILVGFILGAGVATIVWRSTGESFQAPGTEQIDSLPSPDEQAVRAVETNILLPRSLVSEEYYLLLNKVVDKINTVAVSNNATLVPLMNTIRERSISGEFTGFFQLVTQAKNEIRADTETLREVEMNIDALKRVNNQDVTNPRIHDQTALLLTSGDYLVAAFTAYLDTLDEMLSGELPTQALFDKLEANIRDLAAANESFQTELNALLQLAKEEAEEA